ncbi:energy-coupling factor transporter transmembrane component T family protein [Motilibacter deserti]|uniref:Energy-coupling factor transporter transmembrane protein EcfT n=1 Tax=Motilibacter deserti TaxID=2714956 RepID=A0ABX0GQS9_9ACTN|nr:energy-coupling factor transporter transmembrane component T [Motilibacter deserti]NHC13204.1 energy-coupling factor transporter transmembrane protein EcfT [Motilibacter deserti]
MPTPGDARSTAPLARFNPVAALGACLVLAAAALAARDAVTEALLLVPVAGGVLLARVGPRALARRGWPVLLGALSVFLSNALLAPGPGLAVADAAPLVLRVVVIALPGLLVATTVDPTDLADALVQRLHAPARFAYGTLAALRLMPLLAAEWRALGLARRARGVDAGRNPVAALRLFAGQAFALFVAAVRRAARLATAMDARGFDTAGPRTIARAQPFGRRDALLLGATLLLAVAATATSVALGTWEPVLG